MKMTGIEIGHLRRLCGDLIDYEAEVDSTLSYEENLDRFRHEFGIKLKSDERKIGNRYKDGEEQAAQHRARLMEAFSCPEEFAIVVEPTREDCYGYESSISELGPLEIYDGPIRIDRQPIDFEDGKWDDERIEAASRFLDGRSYVLYKTPRTGCTTSLVLAAGRQNKRILTIAPTTAIGELTVKKASKDAVNIPGNRVCRYNADAIDKDPLLAHLPMSLPSKCGHDCKYWTSCEVADILRNPGSPQFTLTTAKLVALMNSRSLRARKILDILSTCAVIVIEESHRLGADSVVTIPLATSMWDLAAKLDEYPQLRIAIENWEEFRVGLQDSSELQDLELQLEYQPDGWLARDIYVSTSMYPVSVKIALGELKKLARRRWKLGIRNEEILDLLKVIEILSEPSARLHYAKSGGKGMMTVVSGMGKTNRALRRFLNREGKDAQVLFVSGTQFEPYPGFFEEISGRKVKHAIFPDLKDINSKMKVYADTFKFSTLNVSLLGNIVSKILEIAEDNIDEDILVVAPNKSWYEMLKWNLRSHSQIHVDYYRASSMIGVECNYRIMVAVGMAEIPQNSCDPLTKSWEESQKRRINLVDAETIQAWGRVKDPDGIVPSKVYALGVRLEDVQRALTWGPGRTVEIDNGSKRPHYSVSCSRELKAPEVFKAVHLHEENPSRRKTEDLIRKVWYAEGDLAGIPEGYEVYEYEIDLGRYEPIIGLGKPTKSRNNIICGLVEKANPNLTGKTLKVRAFGRIVSNPTSQEEWQDTVESCDKFFRGNKSKHAEQSTVEKDDKFPYYPHKTTDFPGTIKASISGGKTVGFYSLGEDGKTPSAAMDFDSHNGETPIIQDVSKMADFVEQHGAQALVIRSGDFDSAHVYVPIVRTHSEISYEAMKTMRRELGLGENAKSYPRQAGSTKAHSLGSLADAPLAIDKKTGARAEFIDHRTQKVLDVVFINTLVELRAYDDVVEEAGRQYVAVAKSNAGIK